jgi:non-specific serine/threonine protein kinase
MCLQMLAEIAVSRGHAGRAARMLGAAHAILEATGVSIMTELRTRSSASELRTNPQIAVALARKSLGETAFAEAWAEGKAMPIEDAVGFALSTAVSRPFGPVERVAPTSDASAPLTRRERNVAELVGRGLTNREIAAELVISTWTASTHVRNILGKLGIGRRAQLAAWTVEHAADRGF